MAVKVTVEKPKQPPPNMCSGCKIGCCTLIVDLTSYDMFRLAIMKERLLPDFVELAYANEDDSYAFRADIGMVKFILKRKGNGFCTFVDQGADLKCTAEDAKPGICLAYPFTLREGKAVMREDAMCPPANRLLADRTKMSVPVLEDAVWEMQRYQEFVDDWNLGADGKKQPMDFLKFAAKETELEKTPWGRLYRKTARWVLYTVKGSRS